MKIVKVTGVKSVLKNLTNARTVVVDRVGRGLVKGGLFLQRKSQEIVPVQFGVLKASAFTRRFGSGLDTDVVVGYTAEYAAVVHENPNVTHGREFNAKHATEMTAATSRKKSTVKSGMFLRGENQTYKFLERPARENVSEILHIVATEAGK